MNDDLIRNAVHELVGAAPEPKALPSAEPPRSNRWMAIAAALVVTVGGLVAIVSSRTDEPSVGTDDPAPTVGVTIPALDDTSPISTPATPSSTAPPATTTTTPPTTTLPPNPALPVGQFDLGPDDLIARRVDGDVYVYPDALTDTPGEPDLLIDREDPRPDPVEGPGPNIIDRVAGTYAGALVYGDCCEPASGSVLAITEPGAESDLWASPSGTSVRAVSLSGGYDPALEPTGTRLVTSNWIFVSVIDLATGERQDVSPNHSTDESGNMTGDPFDALTATWSPSGTIVVLGRSDTGSLILTEHSTDDLRTELRRVELDPTPTEFGPDVEFIDLDKNIVSVVRYTVDGHQIIDIDAASFQVVDIDRTDPSAPGATVVRHSIERDAWAWIVDETAFIQIGESPAVRWNAGIADIWFPTVIRTAGGLHACPTDGIESRTGADLDGDGTPESLVVTTDPGQPGWYDMQVCETALDVTVRRIESPNDALVVTPVDIDGDGADEVWWGGTSGTGLCGTIAGLDGTELIDGDSACFSVDPAGSGGQSWGCEVVDGRQRLVNYTYRFIDGSSLDDAVAFDYDVTLPGAAPVATNTFTLPAQRAEAESIMSPHCNGEPVH